MGDDHYHYHSLVYKAGLFMISVMATWLLAPLSSLWRVRDDDEARQAEARRHQAQAVREMLHVASYRDMAGGADDSECPTCAVCLNQVRSRDKVRELRNCTHVFHKNCLDSWLDHDEHLTCPLCRAPLLACRGAAASVSPEPSWAVEKLLYLFGDDLLFPTAFPDTTPFSLTS